jgi:hypothetical protein
MIGFISVAADQLVLCQRFRKRDECAGSHERNWPDRFSPRCLPGVQRLSGSKLYDQCSTRHYAPLRPRTRVQMIGRTPFNNIDVRNGAEHAVAAGSHVRFRTLQICRLLARGRTRIRAASERLAWVVCGSWPRYPAGPVRAQKRPLQTKHSLDYLGCPLTSNRGGRCSAMRNRQARPRGGSRRRGGCCLSHGILWSAIGRAAGVLPRPERRQGRLEPCRPLRRD